MVYRRIPILQRLPVLDALFDRQGLMVGSLVLGIRVLIQYRWPNQRSSLGGLDRNTQFWKVGSAAQLNIVQVQKYSQLWIRTPMN